MTEEEQKQQGAGMEDAAPQTRTEQPADESSHEESHPTGEIETGTDQPDPTPTATEPPPESTGRTGTLISLLAVLLAIAAATMSGYLWWQTMEGKSAAKRAAAEVKDDTKELRKDVKDLSKKLKDSKTRGDDEHQQLDGRIDELTRMGPRLKAAEQAIDTLSGSALSARQAWLEAEAEYLMQIANTRLRLAQDVETSVAALEAADERLRGLDQPRLLEVRDLLAAEIQTLRALPKLDTQGVALKLGALATEVDRFPLNNALPEKDQDGSASPEGEAGWERAKAVVSGALKDMVSVRRAEEAVVPLLAATDEFLMRRNLELQLLTARLAALKADSANYEQSLADAKRWLREYFDTEDTAVTAAIDAITMLETEQVALAVPDISGSLDLLRQLTIRGE